VDAKDLNLTQSAMLAGMVQSSSALNPYTNPEGVLERRNTVLDTMITNIPDRATEIRAAKTEPLGVLPEPKALPRGCIAAGDQGFFCDYALQYLAASGLSKDQINRGGYTIKTTLDPTVQTSVKSALVANANPKLDGIANVMNVVEPGQDQHRVLAMASSRAYGLDTAADQTVQPQTYTLVGHGAGSIFKIFTTAAAMEKGLGTSAILDVPQRFEARGMGNGGARGCPAATYCVQNASNNYASKLSVTDALAQSPNTAFVKLIESTGVTPTVDMAIRLGLRSYTAPGSSGFGDQSMADMQKQQNLGSFTLGPTWVNPLELANVAATLASHGKWCPPSPIDSITDREGKPVSITQEACEQVVEPGLADTLSVALSKDDQPGGTSFAAASSAGWKLPMSGKTGTTESHMSSGFLGFTNNFAASVLVYGDSTTPGEICSAPLRPCGDGNLYGGTEPARTWFQAMMPLVGNFGPIALPPVDEKYVKGSQNAQVPDVVGLTQDAAVAALKGAGFTVNPVTTKSDAPKGNVTGSAPSGLAVPGSAVTIYVSDGSVKATPSGTASPRPTPSPGG
ncbi:MAG: penicillin-binding protein, partial [Nocardiaceae bacterium]|nr:penicillin-binding protein [Nocardiaceae bacterium]